jgi:protocatechuate 3,4-dioxygenase beta subunit
VTASLPTVPPRHGRIVRLAAVAAAVLVLITAGTTQAANATNINVQLPTAFSIAGTIRDSAGAGLPGASVLAIGSASSGFASTDGTGKYKVAGLNPGSYSILIFAPSTKNLVDGYYTTANSNHFTVSSASATKVTVGPNKTGIDVKLPAGYTITGTITNTGGSPLAGASVIASGVSSDSTTTDATGKYTLRGLAAGGYKLRVNGPGGNYLNGWYTSGNANHFTISAGSATSIALGPNKTGVNVKIPTGYTISGKVTATNGTPLANVGVSAASTTYAGPGATTDGSGNFTLKGLAAGTYKLALSPSDTSGLLDGFYTTANSNHFTTVASSASGIAVGPNKTGVTIKIPFGYSIAGTITDTAGHPLAYAGVFTDNRSASTDAAGKYILKGLKTGSHTLQVEPPYGMNLQSGYYTTANSNHFTTVFASATAIAVGPSKTGVNIKIPAGFTISGKITGPGGVAQQYASVYASASNGSGSALTAADGTYKIVGLSKATYKVYVYPPYPYTLQTGYYTTANSAHFTTNPASATGVAVGP